MTFSVMLGLVAGIVTLVVVIWLLARLGEWLRGGGRSGRVFVAQDFIHKDTLVTVKVAGSDTIERVKFIGFTKAQAGRPDGVPFQFARMAVFENEARERIYIPSAHIQYMKELPAS